MSNWDYIAIFSVWYLISARPAIGIEYTMNITTRALWPFFFVRLFFSNFKHSRHKMRIITLSVLFVISYIGYTIATLITDNTLFRFLLAFPISGIGGFALIAGGSLLYGQIFSPGPPNNK